jgi:hypothetical protein
VTYQLVEGGPNVQSEISSMVERWCGWLCDEGGGRCSWLNVRRIVGGGIDEGEIVTGS